MKREEYENAIIEERNLDYARSELEKMFKGGFSLQAMDPSAAHGSRRFVVKIHGSDHEMFDHQIDKLQKVGAVAKEVKYVD
jgi:hypothetical protein